MKRVLIFSFAYYPHVGGAEVAIKEITDRLGDVSFDLVTYNLGHDKINERIGRVNVYRVSSPTKFLFPLLSFFKGLALHKKNRYQAIWSVMANTGFAALGIRLLFPNVKFILTMQEGDPISRIKRRVWFVYPIFRAIFKQANAVTAISSYLADFAKNMGAKQVEIIPNGVDLYKFKKKKEKGKINDLEKVVLITTGRLVKKNAIGDIINALKFLPDNVIFRSIGSGENEKELRKLVIALELSGRVEFLPLASHNEIVQQLNNADIFIRPSLSEGLGNSFLEAMAVGLPIVGTNVGGIPDFLIDEETGLFCRINDPEDIAQKILKLINDPSLYIMLSSNGRRLIEEKYNWDIVAPLLGRLF